MKRKPSEFTKWTCISILSFIVAISIMTLPIDKDNLTSFFYLYLALTFLIGGIVCTKEAVREFKLAKTNKNNLFFYTSNANTVFDRDATIITTQEEWDKFLSQHTLVDTIYTNVAGVTYNNSDGSSRQSILSKCRAGDEIKLNYFDHQGAPAYAIITKHGQVGNLPANIATNLDSKYDNCIVQGTIESVTGGFDDLYWGCTILVKVYLENSEPASPEPQTEHFTTDYYLNSFKTGIVDPLLPTAVDTILQYNTASISTLQRGMRLPYVRAAEIIDEMESKGVIGHYRNSKPREIFITPEQWKQVRLLIPRNTHVNQTSTGSVKPHNVDPEFIAEAQWHTAHHKTP